MLDARWCDSKRRLSSRIYQGFGGPFEKVSNRVPIALNSFVDRSYDTPLLFRKFSRGKESF